MIRILGVLMVISTGASAYGAAITTGSLVREMADMRRMADFPEPAFKTVQFSSYDHRSVLPGGPDWFANSDGFGSEPVPNFEAVIKASEGKTPGEYLICDVEGPGAIVRTWSARMRGTIRVYLDAAETPIFDGASEDFLMRTYQPFAKDAGLAEEVLKDTFFQRNAAYCPIPFAKHCRIVWIGNIKDTHFYQIQIRLYDKGANVVTFTPQDLKTYAEDIQRVSKTLANPEGAWEYASKEQPIPIAVKVAPGTKEKALELAGPKAIERLTIKVAAKNVEKALRQTILHVVCDGSPWGQVQSPVGDFFGAAPGINPFVSVPFTVTADGTMTCRYVMPCAKNLTVLFENLGDQEVEITGGALPMEYAWNDARSMHFRARWRVNHDAYSSRDDVQDMPYLVAQGAGVYVGTALMLLNPNNVPTSGGNWWGEGDEKIFVDDDVRPSTFGTGSEDYFNYAWSAGDIFGFPYCGQPRNDGPANRGFVTNQRWHIVDPLPFKQRMAFYIELFCHEPTHGYSYARIGYHYAKPGLIDDHVVITREDVRPLQLPAAWQPEAKARAKNSVFFEAEKLLESKKNVMMEKDNLWTSGSLCRWKPKKQGDLLTLKFPVEQEDTYVLRLGVAVDAHSGKVCAMLDGKATALGGDVAARDGCACLYTPDRTLSRTVDVGKEPLKKGNHTITLRYEGGEPGIGIDFLWLQHK